MFQKLQNQQYIPSDSQVITITKDHDFCIDDESMKIHCIDASGSRVTITFDPVNCKYYEELVFHAYVGQDLTVPGTGYVALEIGDREIELDFTDQVHNQFMLFVIDCASFGTIGSITVHAKVPNLVMFIDLLGVRKVTTESMDKDVLQAIADSISLDYGVTTQLRTVVAAGSKDLPLLSKQYLNSDTLLHISEGSVQEKIEIDGFTSDIAHPLARLKRPLNHSYTTNAVVKALCPVLYGKHNQIANNPVVGVIIVDRIIDKQYCYTSGKVKVVLGELVVNVYIECTNEKKLHALCRQFEMVHGDAISFILDGQYVEAYIQDDNYIGPELGGIPRQVYTYQVQGQPITESKGVPVTDLTIKMESVHG